MLELPGQHVNCNSNMCTIRFKVTAAGQSRQGTCYLIAVKHGGKMRNDVFPASVQHRSCGPMDKASAYGAGDCRFESYQDHFCRLAP